jgi:hypothetical protein
MWPKNRPQNLSQWKFGGNLSNFRDSKKQMMNEYSADKKFFRENLSGKDYWNRVEEIIPEMAD